jgi:hypothetical protein
MSWFCFDNKLRYRNVCALLSFRSSLAMDEKKMSECKICTGEALLREETHSVRWKLHPNLKVNQCARTLLYLTPCTYIKAAINMLIYLPFHSKHKERKNIYLSSSRYNIIIYYYLKMSSIVKGTLRSIYDLTSCWSVWAVSNCIAEIIFGANQIVLLSFRQ